MNESELEALLIDIVRDRYSANDAKCPATTKAGNPCRGKAMRETGRCRTHTSADEASAALAAREATEMLIESLQDEREPACWAWPPPSSLIDREPYDWLWAWQQHRCAICGADREHLLMDHNHRSGLVRGWLCHSCNISEGMDGRDVGLYAKYRQRSPAMILGVELMYSGRSGAGPDPWLLPEGYLLSLPPEEHPSYIVAASIAEKLKHLQEEES